MRTFLFTLTSINHTAFSVMLHKVTLPGVKGDMTLLADHMPIISALKPGHISMWTSDDPNSLQTLPVPGGFVEMRNNECVVFANDGDELLTSLLVDQALEANDCYDQ